MKVLRLGLSASILAVACVVGFVLLPRSVLQPPQARPSPSAVGTSSPDVGLLAQRVLGLKGAQELRPWVAVQDSLLARGLPSSVPGYLRLVLLPGDARRSLARCLDDAGLNGPGWCQFPAESGFVRMSKVPVGPAPFVVVKLGADGRQTLALIGRL